MKNILLAFILAPMSFGAFLLVASLLIGSPSEGVWAFTFSTSVAYPIAIFVGIPMYLIMRRCKATGLIPYLLAGAILSLIPIGYFVVHPAIQLAATYPDRSLFEAPHFYQSLVILFACLVTVLVFWMIARPDRIETKV